MEEGKKIIDNEMIYNRHDKKVHNLLDQLAEMEVAYGPEILGQKSTYKSGRHSYSETIVIFTQMARTLISIMDSVFKSDGPYDVAGYETAVMSMERKVKTLKEFMDALQVAE